MKKQLVIFLTAASLAAFTMPAGAIVLTPEGGRNVPSAYAKVIDGKVVYDKSPTAYSSSSFNKVLEAYGLVLKPEAVSGVPTSYAKVDGDKVIFNETSIAYEPVAYHSIFTSYGLQLTPEAAVRAQLGDVDYADVVDGKIVFVKISTAYDGEGFATILSAYNFSSTVVEASATTSGVASKQVTQFIDTDQDGVQDSDDACPDTPLGARVDERGCWTLNTDYLFDFDKSVVKVQYYPYLDELIPVMDKNPGLKVEIQGHADSTGTNIYNQALSERRAKAVRTYLIKKNVGAPRLTSVGFGEEKPAYSNDTDDGRTRNRRVELKPIK
ncbi:MAG: OmpA family protein [Proteobacteria bacterium]|nr:OmpA family protein [Pseudomonadota bacterium]